MSGEYIYIARQTRPDMLSGGLTTHEQQAMAEHSSYLKDLADQGVVILFGRTQTNDEDTFGLVILRANSEESARQIMANDPAIAKEVLSARLYPYRVAGRARD
jgi:uncharacterized protein YciI